MTERPIWTYSGAVPLGGDLSVLESDLHAGRIEAVERGYRDEPDSIELEEAMLLADGDRLVTAAEAEAAGLEFAPTHTRFVMSWHGES
jgi:hypothetical protein